MHTCVYLLFASRCTLQNGASGGGVFLPRHCTLQNGASDGQISAQHAPSVYSATKSWFSAPIFSASVGDVLMLAIGGVLLFSQFFPFALGSFRTLFPVVC
jgi:hypothetical protein